MEEKKENVVSNTDTNIEQERELTIETTPELPSLNQTEIEEQTTQGEPIIEEKTEEAKVITQVEENKVIEEPAVVSEQETTVEEPIQSEEPVKRLADEDQVIAQIAPEKEVKPYFVLVLFGALLIFAFILPSVNDKITAYINSKIPVINQPNYNSSTQGNKQETPKEDDATEKFDLNAETILELGNIKLSKFEFSVEGDNNYLTYEATKIDPKASVKDNMYLELYNAENTLITRAKVNLSNYATSNTTFSITNYVPSNANTTSKIALVEKNENDFPYVELKTQVDGKQRIVCTRNNHELTYIFQDYFLTGIEETYNGVKGTDVEKYTLELSEYQKLNVSLKAFEGVSSELVTSDTGFTMTNIIDLSKTSLTSLGKYSYFEASTIARKVNFEMESMGYTCS